jgi:hypothetical protein
MKFIRDSGLYLNFIRTGRNNCLRSNLPHCVSNYIYLTLNNDRGRKGKAWRYWDASLLSHNYLQWGALCRQRREAHDVAEVDGDTVIRFGYDGLPQDKLTRHRPVPNIQTPINSPSQRWRHEAWIRCFRFYLLVKKIPSRCQKTNDTLGSAKHSLNRLQNLPCNSDCKIRATLEMTHRLSDEIQMFGVRWEPRQWKQVNENIQDPQLLESLL